MIIEGGPTRALVKAADIIQQPSVPQTPDLIKPSKNPINLYDQPLKSSDIFTPFSQNQPIISLQTPSKQNSFPQNQPVIPDTFTPFLQTPSKQNHPVIPDTFTPFTSLIKQIDKPLLPRPPNNFPPVNKLLETDLKDLERLIGTLPVMHYDLKNKIKALKRKPKKTEMEMDTLQDFLRYKKELSDYIDYFNSYYIMRNNFDQITLKPFSTKSVPGGLFNLPFIDELGTLNKKELMICL